MDILKFFDFLLRPPHPLARLFFDCQGSYVEVINTADLIGLVQLLRPMALVTILPHPIPLSLTEPAMSTCICKQMLLEPLMMYGQILLDGLPWLP